MSPSLHPCRCCGATARFAREVPATGTPSPRRRPIGFFSKLADGAGTPPRTSIALPASASDRRTADGAALRTDAVGGPPAVAVAPPVPATAASPATPAIPAFVSALLSERAHGNGATKPAPFPMFRMEVCAACGQVEWFIPERFLTQVKTRFSRTP